MGRTNEDIIRNFGNRLRVRVCGICTEDDRILLVKHRSLGNGVFWAPPGGGMQFGYSAEENLKREFMEETGLEIAVGAFLCTHEFLDPPLHAIELFFRVSVTGGTLQKGMDPEMSDGTQIIDEVRFVPFEEIHQKDAFQYHNIIHIYGDPLKIQEHKGYFIFRKNSEIGSS